MRFPAPNTPAMAPWRTRWPALSGNAQRERSSAPSNFGGSDHCLSAPKAGLHSEHVGISVPRVGGFRFSIHRIGFAILVIRASRAASLIRSELEAVMAVKRFAMLIVLAAVGPLFPSVAAATAIANSMLNFRNLSIVPAVGAVTLADVWLLQAFAAANNSLGESDAQFNFALSPGTTSASAAVTWATGTGTATALGAPPDLIVGGSAASSVNIPCCNPAAAFSEGHGRLSNSFTVDGAGPVSVQFGADISGVLNVMTDQCGLNAFTQAIFTLSVNGGDPPSA
jgi:hypothetical protein